MNVAIWFGLGIGIIYLIYIWVKGLTANMWQEYEISSMVALSTVAILIVSVTMFCGGLIYAMDDYVEMKKRYKDSILNGTFEIQTTHELVLTENGDTVKYEIKRKVVLPQIEEL